LESGGQKDVFYTDQEKAFDKVPHKLLIRKLKSHNLDPQVVEWIISFLSNREQRIRLNNPFSEWKQVISGIPQGSILGPLLFLIYVNDNQDLLLGSRLYWNREPKFIFITTFCLNLLKFNGDEDTGIEALPASVNFCCLVV